MSKHSDWVVAKELAAIAEDQGKGFEACEILIEALMSATDRMEDEGLSGKEACDNTELRRKLEELIRPN